MPMKLLQKIILTLLLQVFGLFILNPIFALSIENINTVSGVSFTDFCGANIQCYEINKNEYKCEQNDAWMTNSQSHASSIQSWKHDNSIYQPFWNGNLAQTNYKVAKNQFYKNPDIDIYPFVGIIKIQV